VSKTGAANRKVKRRKYSIGILECVRNNLLAHSMTLR
jgi:hypothetical protein